MRAFFHYMFAVLIGTLYAGQVCPLMDDLPVRELGLVVLAPMALAYGLRHVLETRYVRQSSPLDRAARQFRLDFGLHAAAALAMAGALRIGYGLPLLQSGLKLSFGIVTLGVFSAFDLALDQERRTILQALKSGQSTRPPRGLSPMTRRFSLVAILTLLLVTSILLLVLFRDFAWLKSQTVTPETIGMLSRSVLVEILFVMAVLLGLLANMIISWARNLKLLLENQTEVLSRVSRGRLDRMVPVATRDELGYIAGHTNAMIAKLRERLHMKEGLRIAREVQRNFLPDKAPDLPGLEIAGTTLYSDETGGDFYDYVPCDDEACGRTAVMVGDVVGHGVGAALLMASARAMLLQGAAQPGSAAETVRHANLHLSRDTAGTGRFLSLFLLDIDPAAQRMAWVNAGHPPALLYDPRAETFTRLAGNGDIPLGVEQGWPYTAHDQPWLSPGQLLLLGTDGIWETRNQQREMYGISRFQDVIRQSATKSAQEILRAVMESISAFRGQAPLDDDITLVVVKGV
ncbi:PP2C family protein-serine/threonine phosphatase [Salidesulfovibrio onnuriiensis]|uniref:PP2C family protein-serine/threonine phosphatase n=1 Tax=Salidesulfovibrio onnuriiensis TaxID=2583823 RepID=UPI0011C82EA7|nr:SpoIIE family protein phosphatase [Salidesulfovibrio onnuriiensis]